MSINLYKHRDELIQSYKDVIDDKNPTEWAVYGYAKDSYDLVLDSTGSGLDQLVDQLDSSKIQYAFVRVVDPKTELIKFVLINWQGEGAALSRKGICANHIRDVSGFFRGAHISINARNEDEVEPAVIIERVAKASATKLNLKERSEPVDNIAPVGTNYNRIKPALEINSSQRESFWQQQQEEERSRKINERKRAELERKKLEEAEKLRELREAKEREQLTSQKERELNKRREEEKNAENRARDRMENKVTASRDEDDEDPEEAISRRAEQMRQNRAEEARTLISGSSIRNARAMFEQNSAASQLTRPQPVPKPAATVTNSLVSMTRKNFIPSVAETKNGSAIPAANGNKSNQTTNSSTAKNVPEVASPSPPPKQQERIEPVTQSAGHPHKERAASPVDEYHKHEQLIEGEEDEDPDSGLVQTEEELLRAVYNDVPITDHILEDIQEESEEAEVEDDVPKPKGTGQQEIKARALYDYQAADETEISFDPDDIITHVDMIDPGWYQGMAPDGSYGLFPANYVEIIQ